MSNVLVTKSDLQEFYSRILPYLGGSADAGFTPVGTIISVMGLTAPANYLACDGTEYNIEDYQELADYFYEQFGSYDYFGGDGETTFAVPDLQGEFLRGSGTNSHDDQGSGSSVGTHQDSTQVVNPYINDANVIGMYVTSTTTSGNNISSINFDSSITGVGFGQTSASITSLSGVVARGTVRPTNTSVLFCIATKNIYLDPSCDYSESEKVVGTWIDGSTLYQITLTTTMPTVSTDYSAATNSIDVSSLGIDHVVSIDGVFDNDNLYIPISSCGSIAVTTDINLSSIWYNKTDELIYITHNRSAWSDRTLYATVRYTKTS